MHTFAPGDIIGYRKNGQPIRLLAGGSEPAAETAPAAPAPAQTPPRAAAEPQYFTQEQVNAIREQEKNKVYGRVDTLQERLDALMAKENEREEAARLQAEAAAEAERARVESETDVRTLLEQEREERRREVEALRLEAERERVLREQEARLNEFNEYRRQAVAAAADSILPELIDYVRGDSPEEIQQSIADLTARSEQIISNTTEAISAQRQAARTVQPTGGVGSADILATQAENQWTPDKIAALTPTEYAKHRASFGIGGGGKGLFG